MIPWRQVFQLAVECVPLACKLGSGEECSNPWQLQGIRVHFFDPGGIAEISRWSQTTGTISTPEGSQKLSATLYDPSGVGALIFANRWSATTG